MAIMLPERLRATGINVIGDVPWGTHFCQFYDSKEDLIDILVPYFKAGLENNEFCMWVTCEPLDESAARSAMRQAVPDLDRYLATGQLEILGHGDWYLKGGTFESQRVLQGWVDKLNNARAKGFDGLRLTGNTFWLEKSSWQDFTDYEEAVNDVIGRYRIIAICTYCLSRCAAPEIMDVIKNHQFALIRRQGQWETVESAERRRLGEALLASEERYRRIVETAAEGIWVVDAETKTTVVNGNMAHLLGYTVEEMIGESILAYTDGAGREAIVRTAERDRSATGQHDIRFRHKSGSELWAIMSTAPIYDNFGQYAGTLHMITDITERKTMEGRLLEANERLRAQTDELTAQAEELAVQAEELRATNDALVEAQHALAKSEQRYRLLFEQQAGGVAIHEIVCDEDGRPCDYRFLDVNPAFERLTGLKRDLVVGKTVRIVMPGIEQHWIDTYGDVALSGRPVRFESPSGPLERSYEVIAFSPEKGQFATLFVDITERRSAEQLREEYLALITHDLRNPLTSIMGRADWLKRRLDEKGLDQESTGAEAVALSARRMRAMLVDLAESAHLESGRLQLQSEAIDLLELIAAVGTRVGTLEDQSRIQILAHEWVPPVLADTERVERAVTNLIVNALKYSPADRPVVVTVSRDDGMARISVTDRGVGIPPEEQQRVFDRGFRAATAGKREGLGLGLYITRLIAEAHGGRVWAESELGRGSTFHLTLPLAR